MGTVRAGPIDRAARGMTVRWSDERSEKHLDAECPSAVVPPLLGAGWDHTGMWEDERAPMWRRRMLAWRLLGFALLGLSVAAVAVVFIANNGWAFLAWVVLTAGCVAAFTQSGTYSGRLGRPRSKAEERARKAQARARREGRNRL